MVSMKPIQLLFVPWCHGITCFSLGRRIGGGEFSALSSSQDSMPPPATLLEYCICSFWTYEDWIGDIVLFTMLSGWSSVQFYPFGKNGMNWPVHVLTALFLGESLIGISFSLHSWVDSPYFENHIDISAKPVFYLHTTTNFQGSTPTAIFHTGLY